MTGVGGNDCSELSALEVAALLLRPGPSPLQRARRTAELAGFGHLLLRIDDDLVEWNYGDYKGLRTVDIRRERPGWRLFEVGCPGGETAEAVGARADRFIRRIRAMPGDALVFAHRDILRVLAARWLGLSATKGSLFQLAPTSLSVLGYDHDPEEPVIPPGCVTDRASLAGNVASSA